MYLRNEKNKEATRRLCTKMKEKKKLLFFGAGLCFSTAHILFVYLRRKKNDEIFFSLVQTFSSEVYDLK